MKRVGLIFSYCGFFISTNLDINSQLQIRKIHKKTVGIRVLEVTCCTDLLKLNINRYNIWFCKVLLILRFIVNLNDSGDRRM